MSDTETGKIRKPVPFVILIAAAIAPFAALVLGVLVVLHWNETVNEEYGTQTALAERHPDLAERLPAAARDIKLRWFVEGGDLWATFKVDGGRPPEWSKHCKSVRVSEVRFETWRPPSWWPEALSDSKRAARSDYVFARCDLDPPYPAYQGRPTAWIALPTSGGQAYWWAHYD